MLKRVLSITIALLLTTSLSFTSNAAITTTSDPQIAADMIVGSSQIGDFGYTTDNALDRNNEVIGYKPVEIEKWGNYLFVVYYYAGNASTAKRSYLSVYDTKNNHTKVANWWDEDLGLLIGTNNNTGDTIMNVYATDDYIFLTSVKQKKSNNLQLQIFENCFNTTVIPENIKLSKVATAADQHPTEPWIKVNQDSINIPDGVSDLYMIDNYLVITGSNGTPSQPLNIIDVSNPSQLDSSGSTPSFKKLTISAKSFITKEGKVVSGVRRITFKDNYAYILANVTVPTDNGAGTSTNVNINHVYLFIAQIPTGKIVSGIEIWDTKTIDTVTGLVVTSASAANAVCISGNYVYISETSGGSTSNHQQQRIAAIDISDRTNPTITSINPLEYDATAVSAQGSAWAVAMDNVVITGNIYQNAIRLSRFSHDKKTIDYSASFGKTAVGSKNILASGIQGQIGMRVLLTDDKLYYVYKETINPSSSQGGVGWLNILNSTSVSIDQEKPLTNVAPYNVTGSYKGTDNKVELTINQMVTEVDVVDGRWSYTLDTPGAYMVVAKAKSNEGIVYDDTSNTIHYKILETPIVATVGYSKSSIEKGKITSIVNFNKTTTDVVKLIPISAVYKGNKLITVSVGVEIEISRADNWGFPELTLTVPDDTDYSDYIIKTFLWNDLTDIHTLAGVTLPTLHN